MTGFPLPQSDLSAAGLRAEQIDRLVALIERHIAEGRYPGAQIAIARHGSLALFRTFGNATLDRPADDRTLWLLYSNTKVVTAAALWVLAERGLFRFTDRVSDHVPAFARNGKRDVTVLQLLTHRGGFPNAVVPQKAWEDHALLKETVCDFSLEWTPGSKLAYHGLSAHWTAAVLIEALTGQDFREVIRETVIAPLGLQNELMVGLPKAAMARTADMHEPAEDGVRPIAENNTPAWKKAGLPGAGGYATARAMAALYQMMVNGGALGGTRLLAPRTLSYAIRNWTGDMVDEYMGMPMHRGIGPHLRGTTEGIRGLGGFASPRTFGHGGVGSSYCWGDPDSGVSFAYLTNCRIPDPWHSLRLDLVSNFVHSAII
ncbi:serine hydrolase domain-containing protein [Limobrevibacterium gyesilva]|uniref:Beta-lactamase family protein n=1 Tax=Limobrevibacterium gyesilva TaxID=2991712 RepID=A0AA41YND3_9PROT|nr:serine hydrolase domain-containing protein [Limobrevibacterium gyesilva]MCW3473500.1 beta-lactamase family protein [Limobrevibacterium gyesilva]